jgi:Spy/CpxP family protein refolding chaperone
MKRNTTMILAAAVIVTFAIAALAQGPGAFLRGPEMHSLPVGPSDGPPIPDMDAGELLDDPLGPSPQDFDKGGPSHMTLAKGPDMDPRPGMHPGGPHGGLEPPHPGHMGPPPPGGHREFFAKKLGLTDEQKKEMRGLFVNFQDRTRKARMTLATLGDERRTMMMSGKFDEQKLVKIDEETVKVASELMKDRMKMRRDRLALLTQDQIARLADMMMDKPGHGRGHGRMR